MDLGFSVSGLIVVELRILGGGGDEPALQPDPHFTTTDAVFGVLPAAGKNMSKEHRESNPEVPNAPDAPTSTPLRRKLSYLPGGNFITGFVPATLRGMWRLT